MRYHLKSDVLRVIGECEYGGHKTNFSKLDFFLINTCVEFDMK